MSDEDQPLTKPQMKVLTRLQAQLRQIIQTDEDEKRLSSVELEVRREEALRAMVATLRHSVWETPHDVTEEWVDAYQEEIPWSCFVDVKLPQTWWQRLWKKPVKVIKVPATGKVSVAGSIVYPIQRVVRFPDIPEGTFPPEWGEFVQYLKHDPPYYRHSSTLTVPRAGAGTLEGPDFQTDIRSW